MNPADADERDAALSRPDDAPVAPAGDQSAAAAAPSVLRMLLADPQHMAEHLALFTSRHFGPRALAAVDARERAHPNATRDDQVAMAVSSGSRHTVVEGSFLGGPFIVLIPLAFCIAALTQGQMMMELGAIAGNEATGTAQAADLLVILGAYPTVEDAAAALATVKPVPTSEGAKLPRGTRVAMVRRMAYLLGLFTVGDKRSGFRQAVGWIGVTLTFVVGLVLPWVWIPVMGYFYYQSTHRLARVASRYYGLAPPGEAEAEEGQRRLLPASVLIIARTLIATLLPIGAFIVVFFTGAKFLGGRWATAGIVFVVAGMIAGLVWYLYRRRRQHRAASDVASVS
jgi:hypothetical protein